LTSTFDHLPPESRPALRSHSAEVAAGRRRFMASTRVAPSTETVGELASYLRL
jgi:hypothetical protein